MRLFLYFLIAGIAGGTAATAVLWQFLDPKGGSSIFGIADTNAFILFPFVGGLLSGIWAVILKKESFGLMRGAYTALCSFLSFNALYAFSGTDYLSSFMLSTGFGFPLFGWFLVLVGAATGWLYKRSNRDAL